MKTKVNQFRTPAKSFSGSGAPAEDPARSPSGSIVYPKRAKESFQQKLINNPGQGERELRQEAKRRGLGFKSSPPVCGYYPDLVFRWCKLIIEVDGGYHWSKEQRVKDAAKDKLLKKKGWKVIRVWASDAKARPSEVFEGAFVQAFGVGHDKFDRPRFLEKPRISKPKPTKPDFRLMKPVKLREKKKLREISVQQGRSTRTIEVR